MMAAVLLLVLSPPSMVSVARAVRGRHRISRAGAAAMVPAAVAVPRVSASEFSPSRFYSSAAAETPVVVEDALGGDACEAICDEFVDLAGSVPIEIQRRRRSDAGDDVGMAGAGSSSVRTDIYECSVRQALDLMMRSNHDDSVFAFCEGLLDEAGVLLSDDGAAAERMGRIRDAIDRAKAGVFSNDSGGRGGGGGGDWFDHFPEGARPADCVVVAGEGATSTLHRDPFEWVGTSLCLEGSKVWRFLPPPSFSPAADGKDRGDRSVGVVGGAVMEALDGALGSYRLASTAWDDDGGGDGSPPLSAGWQSDRSLFRRRDPSVPSARSLSDMEAGARISVLEEFASDPDALRPDFGDVTPPLTGGGRGARGAGWSFLGRPYWTAVQGAGDLLVIPAHWWHQSYALEPSLSVASQWCDSRRDAARVVRHVLDVTGTLGSAPDLLLRGDYSDFVDCSPRDVVDALFEHVLGFGRDGTASDGGLGG